MKRDEVNASTEILLENFFTYHGNFLHLNINLKNSPARQRYHDNWLGRYRKIVKDWEDYDIAIWSVRCRQSLKLCFSSTYFALAAEESRKSYNLTSAYFLAYYSAMHAMWAVLYLNPEQSISNITDITHSKICNFFHSSHAQGREGIISINAKEFAEDLRFLREYYSYRMPLNSPLDKSSALRDAHVSLGGFVKQSIQLAHLHSHLVHKAGERENKLSAVVPKGRIGDFADEFFLINGKEHKNRGLKLLDPADNASLWDSIKKGCDIIPHGIAYDHIFDNYMTYMDDERPNDEIVDKTRKLVWSALF